MQEIWVQSLGGEDPLEKEMDTHSWKISWIEEFGSLQSMGLQRVGCDLVTVPIYIPTNSAIALICKTEIDSQT